VFDIRLVLSSTRNTVGRATLAAKFLHETGNAFVPVGVGVETPCEGVAPACVGPQFAWVGNYSLAEYPGQVYWDGIGALIAELDNSTVEDPLWVLSISPMGNLAAALRLGPDRSSRARIVSMSGSVLMGYSGTPPPDAEYNVAENVSASQLVYSTPWASPLVTGPLDTTQFFQIMGDTYQRFLHSTKSDLLPRVLLENYQAWYDNGGRNETALQPFSPSLASSTNYDLEVSVIATLLAENRLNPFVAFSQYPLAVNGSGFTVVEKGALVVDAATSWVGGTGAGVGAMGEFVVSALLCE
jgi:inosine-uridine nucleoside N-ribohydrolase